MRTSKGLLVVAATLAECLDCQPGCLCGGQSTCWDHALLGGIHLADSLGKIGDPGKAGHARRLFLVRIRMSLLSLLKQRCEPLAPLLLVLSCGKRLQDPPELFLFL